MEIDNLIDNKISNDDLLKKIEQLKKENDDLNRENSRLKSAFNFFPDVLTIIDQECNIIYTSHPNSVGEIDKRMLHKSFLDFIYAEDKSKVKDAIERIKNNESNFEHIEYRISFFSGMTMWVDSSFAPNKNEPGLMLVATRDLSSQKKREEELNQTQKKYRAIFEGSNDAILIISGEQLVDCNQKALHLFGYENKEEFLKYSISEMHPEIQPDGRRSLDYIRELVDYVYENGYTSLNWLFRKKDKSDLHARIAINSFEYSGKYYLQVAVRDMSDFIQIQQSMQQSEQQLDVILDNTQQIFLLIDKNYRIQIFNRAAYLYGERILGIYIEPGKSVLDYINDEFLPDFIKNFNLAVNGKPCHSERYINGKDGKSYWLNFNYTPVFSDDGQIHSIIYNIRDITQQKEAELKLKHSEDKFRKIMEFSPDVVTILNKDMKLIFHSERDLSLLGYSVDELKDSNLQFVAHPEDVDLVKNVMFRAIENPNEIVSVVYRGMHKNGSFLWIESKISNQLDNPAIKGIIVSSRDITERKQYEIELKNSEERFRVLLDNSPLAISISREFRDVYVNDAYLKLFGYDSIDEALNCTIFDKIAPESRDYVIRHMKEQGENGIVRSYEIMGMKKDGSKFVMEVIPAIIKLSNGFEAIAYFNDITERKKYELERDKFIQELQASNDMIEQESSRIQNLNRRLEESERKLKELNDSKDKFFSIIAHDLRSPMTGFYSIADTLSDHLESLTQDEIKSIVQSIKTSAESLFELLDTLLTWARTQIGRIDFEPFLLNLYNESEKAIEIVYANAANKKIDILNQIPKNLMIEADKYMLNTIIRNLLTNAIKFTNPGGYISLNAAEIGSLENQFDRFIEVSVTDSGVGIEKVVLDKLFKLEHKISTRGTKNEKGSGLGLILCKEFVEKHGGKIYVESQVGEGSRFRFTIPKA